MSETKPDAAMGVFELVARARHDFGRALAGFRLVATHEGHLLDGARATLDDAERLYREYGHHTDIAERSLRMAHDIGTQLSQRLANADTVMSRNITKE